jgi:hypothetical protein
MHDEFDPDALPNPRLVKFEALTNAASESPFIEEGFELLKDAMVLLAMVAGLRTDVEAGGLERNHAILVGHYARMLKLMKSLIRQVSDGHGGDQQISITRQFLDSASTVAYLLRDPGDGSRFDSYVVDSLIAERELLKDVRAQVVNRGDMVLPIEARIRRSIAGTLEAAGVAENEIPSRKANAWPPAQTRIALLGPTAYAAYRVGSTVIHGGFNEIFKNHLRTVGSRFEIELRPDPIRPQPMLMMATLALFTLPEYAVRYLGQPLPTSLEQRRARLLEVVRRVDTLHDQFLDLQTI